MQDKEPLWTPTEASIQNSPIYRFMQQCNRDFGLSLSGYEDLHAWSVAEREKFWVALWEFCAVKGSRGQRTLINGDDMLAARFFPDATLNFAENLLSRSGNDE